MRTFTSVLWCLSLLPPAAVAQSGGIDLLSFAMPGARIVAGANADAAKNSAFGQYALLNFQPDNAALQKFINETGVDPRTDVREVLVATDGAPGPGLHAIVAAHGMFSGAITTLEAAPLPDGRTVTHLPGGVDLIRFEHSQENSTSPCAALYTDGATAAVGDCDTLQAAIASAGSKPPSGSSLLDKAQQVRSQQDLWFTSALPLGQFANMAPGGPNPLLNSPLLKAIQMSSGGVKFLSGNTSQPPSLKVSGDVLMDTADNARSLQNVLSFFLGMVQMKGSGIPEAAPFLALLGNLQTSLSGATLNVSLTILEPALEQLFQQMHHQASAERRHHDSVAH